MQSNTKKLRLAPMMGYTNAPFRLLIRLLSPNTQLYTEMVTVNAVVHKPQKHHFVSFPEEKDVVFQLGGDDPLSTANVALLAEQNGFTEININCGCPSDKVKKGNFGACLMKDPERVSQIVYECKSKVQIPVTVKHRIGLDKNNDYEFVYDFVSQINQAGCDGMVVHARNAWLNGMSPRQNRTIPLLRPEVVWQLKQDFPSVNMCYNGGLIEEKEILDILNNEVNQQKQPHPIDGVMLGRAAWDNPFIFHKLNKKLVDAKNKDTEDNLINRSEIVEQYFEVINTHWDKISHLWSQSTLLKPLCNLYAFGECAAKWRQLTVGQQYDSWQSAYKKLLDEAKKIDKVRQH